MKKIQKNISRTVQTDYGSKTKNDKTTSEKSNTTSKEKKTLSDLATDMLNKNIK